jgi:hypothetical protein
MRTKLKRTLVFLATICAITSLTTAPASASVVGSATFTGDVAGEVTWTNVPLVGLRLSGAFTNGFTNPDPSAYEIVLVVNGVPCDTEMDGVTISPPAVEAFTIPTGCSLDGTGSFSAQAESSYMQINQNGQNYASAPITEI